MASGTVKWFNPTKGYGFIQPAGGGGRSTWPTLAAAATRPMAGTLQRSSTATQTASMMPRLRGG